MILRSTDIRSALRSRQRGFLLNPYRFGSSAPPPTDTYWNNVALLLDGSGSIGANTVTDRSRQAFTPSTLNASVVVQNTNIRFGASALSCPGSTGSDIIYTGSHMMSAPGAFTWEGSFKISNRTSVTFFYCAQTEAAGRCQIYTNAAGKLCWNRYGSAEAVLAANATDIPLNTYFDLSVVRSTAGVITAKVDGTALASTTTDSAIVGNGTGGMAIPMQVASGTFYQDNVRITRGVARTIAAGALAAAFEQAGAAETDSNFSNVALLVSGNADFVDRSSYGHTATLGGAGASISATNKLFGAGSMRFNGSSINDNVTYTDHAILAFGSGNWTLEFLYRNDSVAAGSQHIFSKYGTSPTGPIAILRNGSNIQLYMSSNGTSWNLINGSTIQSGMVAGMWYSIAIERVGTNINIYNEGVKVTTIGIGSVTLTATTGYPIKVGSSGADSWPGNMKNLRYTKVARYNGSNYITSFNELPTS